MVDSAVIKMGLTQLDYFSHNITESVWFHPQRVYSFVTK